MKRIFLLLGLAAGYVLGARAGRERYEKIAKYSSAVWNTKAVQCGVSKVKSFSRNRADDAKDKLIDVISGALKSKKSKQEAQPTQVTVVAHTPGEATSTTVKTVK